MSEIKPLVDACCDEFATEEDMDTLERILRGNPAAIHQYLNLVNLHTSLDWMITSRESIADWIRPQAEIGHLKRGLRSNRMTMGIGATLLALSASLLLVAWTGLNIGTGTEDTPAAMICTHSDSARWVVLNGSNRPEGMCKTIYSDETVHVTAGQLNIEFGDGAEVTLTGPAMLQVLGPDHALAMKGRLSAYVDEEAVGFSIDTPRAQVIDLGTRFGLEVDDLGQTDVVVFEGEVDISYGSIDPKVTGWSSRIMRMGEAVRVDDRGTANRIVSIENDRFVAESLATSEVPIFGSVKDNIRGEDSWNYYGIVRGGMEEDALAYVDREAHQWNGLDESGMPKYLVGGDYIKMFNNDKFADDFEMTLDLQRPCSIYLLFDDRVPAPEWLRNQFRDTGDDIGLDRGPYERQNGIVEENIPDIGPGVSIEDTLSIWVQQVDKPMTVRLGSTETSHPYLNMYGIVAVSLAD